MANGEGSADEVIEKRGLKQVTDSGAIEKVLDEMLAANAEQSSNTVRQTKPSAARCSVSLSARR